VAKCAGGAPHIIHEYEAMYLLFGAVIMGSAVIHLTRLTTMMRAVPVTVIFFVLGIAVALVAEIWGGELGHAIHTYESWAMIEPHLLLFTFLPPLLFYEALTVDVHVARRCCGQCLILAGPGVVMSSFATAALLYALPFNWNFTTSLMVGSIISATDPVAVVSLLKDLGASPVLTMQIQGESLLNDGTAMVLFTVTYGVVRGAECGIVCVVRALITATAGAVALGAFIGYLFARWIRAAGDRLDPNSSTIQISLTIACAYSSFIVAEGICHISGVLSTVAAALVLARKIWPVLVQREAVIEIWHLIETIANTLVFFLAGIITGKNMPQHSLWDFLWVLVVYIGIVAIRLAMILVLRPALSFTGECVSFRDALVMTWGGLRGMVGLALAILVAQDERAGALTASDGDKVLFLVGGVTALTLLINAVTAPALCHVLGITHAVKERQALLRNVARRMESRVDSLVQELQTNRNASRECELGAVTESVERLHDALRLELPAAKSARFRRLPTLTVLQHLASPDAVKLWNLFLDRRRQLLSTGAAVTSFQFDGQLAEIQRILSTLTPEPRQLKVAREVFLETVRANYWEQVQSGKFLVGSRVPQILLNSVGVAMDKCGKRLLDWEVLEHDIGLPDDVPLDEECTVENMGWRQRIMRWVVERRRKCYFKKLMLALNSVTAFVEAHQHAQAQIAWAFGEDESVDTPEEAYVILESQIEVFAAAILRSKIARSVQTRMNTMWEVRRICEQYRGFVMQAHQGGVLHAPEAEALLQPATDVLRELDCDRKRLWKTVSWRQGSNDPTLNEIDAAITIQRAFRGARTSQATMQAPTLLAPTLLRQDRQKRLAFEKVAGVADVMTDERSRPWVTSGPRASL
jgi:NhaP-type Na+/H+ or K+/H+ antiporter